jgi:hypothetical protein
MNDLPFDPAGYDATLVSDAHSAEDMTQGGAPSLAGMIGHSNLYWSTEGAPGRAIEA